MIAALGGATEPSAVPLYNEMHHNFLVANYGADGGCFDNDDGSAWYKMYYNFCPFGGHKTDFDGHSKWSYGNLHVFPAVYGAKCVGILQELPTKGFAEHYTGNTCILGSNQQVLSVPNLRGMPPAQFSLSVLMGNNVSCPSPPPPLPPMPPLAFTHAQNAPLPLFQTIYTPDGTAPGPTGFANYSDFIKAGYDMGSVLVAGIPPVPTIIQWAKDLLF
jgi:hypothetical protein